MSITFQTLSDIVIPDRAVQECKILENYILPDFSDDIMKGWLPGVWGIVRYALSKDPALKRLVAKFEVFEEKVNRLGEREFIELLRETVTNKEFKDWRSFIENGMFLNSLATTNSSITSRVHCRCIF
jgi:hypothetical protein